MLNKLKILICLLSFNLCFANSFYEVNHISFKEGFQAGLQALEFQAKQDGYKQKQIVVSKPFLLVYEIRNIPLDEALFLQIIANKEGFETHLSKDFISFGEFERQIDAKSKAKELLNKFKLKENSIKIYTNTQSFLTYPFLWQDFHTKLLQEAIDLGVIVKEKEKIIYKTIYKNNESPKTQIKTKKLIFKNAKAMSYQSLEGDLTQSSNYKEAGLVKAQEYEFEKEIQTTESEIFVKVKDKNLYFSKFDVEIKE